MATISESQVKAATLAYEKQMESYAPNKKCSSITAIVCAILALVSTSLFFSGLHIAVPITVVSTFGLISIISAIALCCLKPPVMPREMRPGVEAQRRLDRQMTENPPQTSTVSSTPPSAPRERRTGIQRVTILPNHFDIPAPRPEQQPQPVVNPPLTLQDANLVAATALTSLIMMVAQQQQQ